MCGFSGIVDFTKKNNFENNLKLSVEEIKHRGPDNQGYFFDKDNGIFLGFNRLKIIDLMDRSNQPFVDDSKNIVLMFNGEIYNFKNIKQKLEKDFVFKTDSDTEVLLCSYIKWGVDFLKYIEGMFSIVIYDKIQNKIILIRDRFGIKPLFYSFNKENVVFSSEIKGILKTEMVNKKLNLTAIDSYLSFLCVIDNLTPFENIFKLRPGEMITINLDTGNTKNEYYWDLEKIDLLDNEEIVINNVFSKIDLSIQEQMQSDVNFGCFLSGGLDSSINAILMSKHLKEPVKTLSVFFDHKQYNEIKYSRLINDKIQSKGYEKEIKQEDFWEFLNNFGAINDSLNGDLVCFPLYYLSKLTKEKNIKMIQVGEGADEIFCGYNSFKYIWLIKLIDLFWKYTSKINSVIKKIISWSPLLFVDKKSGLYDLIIRWNENLPWYFGANNIFNRVEKKQIFKNDICIDKNFINNTIKKHWRADFSPLQKISYIETKLRLPELLLNRVDLITMNFSIESRVPFLNSNLVKYVFSVDDQLKLKDNNTKYLLKKSMKDIVPNEIIERRKQGFWAPFADWYINDLNFKTKINKIILESSFTNSGLVNKDYIKKLLKQNFNNKNILKVWSLLILTNFYDYYFN